MVTAVRFDAEGRLVVCDAQAWRTWLDVNEEISDGVNLTLAKKGVVIPTSLTYAEALEEALCSGWIDGRRNAINETTFQQRFTPRRSSSIWSKRNVGIVDDLVAAGRMRPAGQKEIDRAQNDGRLASAYAGQATAEIPDDLLKALTLAGFETYFSSLTRSVQYSHVHNVITASSSVVRTRRIERIITNFKKVSPAGSGT